MILNEYLSKSMAYEQELNEHYQEILNEQYYGKNKYTEEVRSCFEQLKKIVNKRKNKYSYEDGITTLLIDKSNSQEIKEIEDKISNTIKKQFNFKDVKVSIISKGVANSITPKLIGKKIFEKSSIDKELGSNGIRYKKPERNVYIELSSELIGMNQIDAGMLTASLYHEIGHNFYFEDSLCTTLLRAINMIGTVNYLYNIITSTFNIIVKRKRKVITSPITIEIQDIPMDEYIAQLPSNVLELFEKLHLLLITPFNSVRGVIMDLENFITSTKFGQEFSNIVKNTITFLKSYNIFKNIVNTSINIFKNVKSFVSKDANSTLKLKGGIITKIGNIAGTAISNATIGRNSTREEMFADNFATSFGYGEDLIRFQKVMLDGNTDYWKSTLNHFKATSAITDLMTLQNRLLRGFADVHPEAVSRIIDQIQYVKDNIKVEPDPKLRAQMESDLKNMEAEYNDLKKRLENKEFAKKGKFVTNFFEELNVKNGGDASYRYNVRKNKERYKGQWKILDVE